MIQAIKDCRFGSEPYLRSNAFGWINSAEVGFGSFQWICDLFDVDPRWVRDRVGCIDRFPRLVSWGGVRIGFICLFVTAGSGSGGFEMGISLCGNDFAPAGGAVPPHGAACPALCDAPP